MNARGLRAALGVLVAVLAALFVLRSAAKLHPPRLASAGLLAAGLAVYAAAFLFRAARLNLLLPPAERIPFGRAWSVSAATTFLLQVIPFRGGELASWAAYRDALGLGWSRAGAVFALVKTLDSAATLLVGLAGASALAISSGRTVLAAGTAALVALGAFALLLLPRIAAALLEHLAPRLKETSRARRAADELLAGLSVVRGRPGLYALALAGALGFLAAHLVALRLILEAFGTDVPIAALAAASLSAVLVAAALPSPAGTFGPMESGFAAGLLLAGIPLAQGAVLGALAHVTTTLVCGIVGLPWMARALFRRQT